MPDFEYACDVADIPDNKAIPVQIGLKWFAVCKDAGEVHATAFFCPHENGPLGKGDVHDGCLICPVHHWRWDLKTGFTEEHPHSRLKIYACQVRDGKVYIDPTSPLPPPTDQIPQT